MSNGTQRIILLIEDDPAIQELLDMQFTSLNVKLYRAQGGLEGVQRYRELHAALANDPTWSSWTSNCRP